MASLRFLSSLFALIAIVALVADATPALNGSGHLHGAQRHRLLDRAGAGVAAGDAHADLGADLPVGVEPGDPQRAQRADVDPVRLPRRRLRLLRPPPRAAQGARQLAPLLLRCGFRRRRCGRACRHDRLGDAGQRRRQAAARRVGDVERDADDDEADQQADQPHHPAAMALVERLDLRILDVTVAAVSAIRDAGQDTSSAPSGARCRDAAPIARRARRFAARSPDRESTGRCWPR